MARQFSIWDLRDSDSSPLFAQPGLVMGEPLSIRQLADNIGQDSDPRAPLGNQRSGCQRDALTEELDTALRCFSDSAHRLYSSEVAAILLMHNCSKDPNFQAPPWLVELFEAHLDVLREVAARSREHGSETDFSEGDE